MKNKIITAFKDNHRDLMISKKTGQFEDVLWNTGYETAMSFVLGLMGINREQALYKYIKWNDLTLPEQEYVKEQYLSIREQEEDRGRDETTQDYPEPMDWRGVKDCYFERKENGSIDVII
jgi:hypothetical protein